MRRTSVMTIGIVLVFIGIQLNLVQTYVLTQRVSDFLSEKSSQMQPQQAYGYANPAAPAPNTAYNSPYYQASYGTPQGTAPSVQPTYVGNTSIGSRTLSPPSWLCWPVLFLGTVVFLHGFSMRRNY